MLINLKVKTLDARTHEFSIDNELTIRQFKDQIAEKTNIAAENQRIIYQGRVLADDKQVKEYDVDGKVLHVAERPPFSQRGANYRNNDEPMRTFRNVSRPTPGSMRTQPYFRALDGMLVGTMAIPVNNHNAAAGARTAPPNRFPNSSSFCINRITVALHMIDCVNNIAAYLENPAVGLNNQSLDILQRGRWSMESTVVEVGVSSTDLPRNNNIIDMVQDAVNAALSRGTNGRNYTVVQLPTVYTNESGETTQQRGNEIDGEGGLAALGGPGSDGSGETTAAAVIIEDVIETDDEAADGASDRSTTPTPDGTDAGDGSDGAFGGEPTGTSSLTAPDTNASGSASADAAASTSAAGGSASNMNVSGIGPRRRTRPQVLANVIQNYRNVQNRLAPFVQRYYEILEQDPVFEESDTAERESAQRIFDRVSEAFHYLSHAQHAISDLMLDLSQPGPRVLTCRPILVEQSGYIRSNNIFAPNLVASPLAELIPNRNPNGGGLVSAQQLLGTLSEPTPPSTSATAVVPSSAVSTATASTASTASNPFQDAATRAHVDAIRANVDAVRSVAQALSSTGSTADQTRSDILSQNLVADLTSEIMHTITNPSTISQDAIHSNGDLRNALARATVDRVIAAGRRFLNSDDVEDPVDEPMVAPSNVSGSASSTPQSPQQPQQPPRPEMDNTEQRAVPRLRLYMPVPLPPPNPQVQMARLIQAVVNSSTNDGDVRVEFNSPNIVSINLPVHVMTAAVRPALTGASGASAAPTATATTTAGASPAPPNDIQSRTAARIGELFANVLPAPNANAASTTASTNTAGAGAASTSTGRDQRATNTLPTTATQTRSTSRPQIQLGGNNNWGGRIAPTHTAFDRFLPCNSHHIREPELLAQHNNNNNNNNNRSTTNAAAAQPPPLSSSLSTPGTGIGVAGIPVMAATSQPLTGSIFAAAAAAAAASGAPSHRVIANRIQRGNAGGNTVRSSLGRHRHNLANSESGSGGHQATSAIQQAASFVGRGSTNGGMPSHRRLRPTSASSAINREWLATRVAFVGGGTINAGVATARRGRAPGMRTMQNTSRLSRQFRTIFANLFNNLRNNAQTASAGSANGAEGLTTATAGAGAIGVNTANASGSPSNTATHSPITAPGSTTGTPTGEATTATTASVLSQFGEGTADAIDDQFNELTSIRAQMRTFLYSSLFRGQTINEQTIPGAITRALNWFDDSLIYLPQYERPEYNSRLSLYNIIGQSLRLVFELCSSGGNPFSLSPEASSFSSTGAQFEQRLKHICDQFRQRLYSVLFLCLGSTNAELYWRQLMRILCVPLRSNFYNGALQFLCIYIDPTIPSETDTVDAQQFLVLRTGIPPSALQEQQQMFDTDIEMLDMDAGASSSNTDPEPLPSVTVGAEPWHINFPSEWLPVITRDLQTQTEQNRSQPPYSDAYISGMSAKRRKVIQAEKPTPTVECLIANGVQRAMQGAGINSGNASASSSSSISPDAVIDAIANDDGIQATYTEAVRTNTRERIKQDVDYSPNKYPQIAKFTEQK